MRLLGRASFLFLLLFFAQHAVPAQRVRTFDALHYVIRTKFDKSRKTIDGETTVTFRPLADGLATLELDAVGLDFSRVRQMPNGDPLKFKVTPDKVRVELGRVYGPSETVSVALAYTAKPKLGVKFVPAESAGGGRLIHDTQIWTQGQAEYSRYWFPSYDYPDDKATTEQFLTVDANETAIANGELIGRAPNADGTATYHYRMTWPHSTYLTSFVVGKYTVRNDVHETVPLRYFVYPGREDLFQTAFAKTPAMMGVFENLTNIKFPFNKYDQTIVARFDLGGMENVTATTLADSEIFFVDFNQLVVEDIISHELAHSWFGNLVTCRTWADLWLNEGFATFMEGAFRERTYGRADYLRKLGQDQAVYFAEESRLSRTHPLSNPNARGADSDFDMITYKKGGLVVHMLRDTVGDGDFWKAINLYLNRHRLGNATSEDLRRALEEVSGKDLKTFFAQWIYGAGYPKLNIRTRYDAASKTLVVKVAQTQKPSPEVKAAFAFPLEIETSDGDAKSVATIDVKAREETFSVKLAAAPKSIEVDPRLRVPVMSYKLSKD